MNQTLQTAPPTCSRALRVRWVMLAKRTIDVVGSLGLLFALTPVVVAASIAIALSTGMPVLHLAKRWGWRERQFTCYKLRTMCVDQDHLLAQRGLGRLGEAGQTLIFENDPRIDGVGAFVRKYSLDEIPQLFNVLRGDMSLIGPRALVLPMLEDCPEIRAVRSVVRPGISGLWQVRNRRKNVTVFDMLSDDMEYIAKFSLVLDLKIALRTLSRIVEPPL